MITMRFFLNPASFVSQATSAENAAKLVETLVECLKLITPAVTGGRYALVCLDDLDTLNLSGTEPFSSTVNSLRARNADISRLWYSYTRNHTAYDNSNPTEFEVSLEGIAQGRAHTGRAPTTQLVAGINWLGFGGTPVLESPNLKVTRADTTSYLVANSYTVDQLKEIIPCFEHSDKHRKDPYYDAIRKENVAAMPIRDVDAANVVLRSGVLVGGDYFSYHQISGRYFRFKNTRANIYHGFQVDQREIHPNIVRLIRPGQ